MTHFYGKRDSQDSDSQLFFFLQTDQLNLRFNYETVENFTYLTSQETALKFMIVIGLFANKKT